MYLRVDGMAPNYWLEANARKFRCAVKPRSTNRLRDDGRRPPFFTGKQGEAHYYFGRQWTAGSDLVGYKGDTRAKRIAEGRAMVAVGQ